MKKWVENKEPSGAVVHTLVFGHHGDDPKVIVALFRDSEGDWFTTSNVLDTYWDLLTGKEVCEHDAKMMVEERSAWNVCGRDSSAAERCRAHDNADVANGRMQPGGVQRI